MTTQNKASRFRMLVEELLPSLGIQEGKIAKWMIENEEDVVNTPIKDIASICSVSQPSVVRLCKKLGCNGIKELKILVDSLKANSENSNPCTFDDEPKEIFKKVFSSSLESIERTFSDISFSEIESSSEKIINSSTISVFGIGGSAFVARHLSDQLLRLGLKSMCFTDSFSIESSASNYSKDDLVIFISRQGESKSLLEKAKKAKNLGAHILTITTVENSTLFLLSDSALKVSENQYILDDRNSYSRLGEIALIEALYIMCAKKIGEINPTFRENYFGLTNYKKEKK